MVTKSINYHGLVNFGSILKDPGNCLLDWHSFDHCSMVVNFNVACAKFVPHAVRFLGWGQKDSKSPIHANAEFQGRFKAIFNLPCFVHGFGIFSFKVAIGEGANRENARERLWGRLVRLPPLEPYFLHIPAVFSKLIHHLPYTEKKLQPLRRGKIPCLCLTALWLEFRKVWPK